jgi:hypothetical protein
MARRWLASALSLRCFPAVHHKLQHPRPTADPAVPSSPSNALGLHAPPPRSRIVPNSMRPRKTYRTGRAGDLGAGIAQKLFILKALCTWLSRKLMILRIELSALLAPYRARPGTATPLRGFQRPPREVRGCRRACERTRLRGRRRCAAGGRLLKQVKTFRVQG